MSDKPKKITMDKKTVYIYSGVFVAILLVYILCAVVIPLMLHKHTLVKTEAVSATCAIGGNYEYWTCTECEKVYEDEAGKIRTRKWKMKTEKLKHIFGEADCTHAKTCELCNNTEGLPLGHDFEPTTYVWAENMSECTAMRTCRRDPTHVECETAPAILTDNYYTVEFLNIDFGTARVYNRGENGYENTYEGEKLPTLIENAENTFELDKLGTISYPASNTAHDFDITYIEDVKYRFVGMANNTIRLYVGDDYTKFYEMNHSGPHRYIAVSPESPDFFYGKAMFTGYAGKLEWISCDMVSLTLEPVEYTSNYLQFDQYVIGKEATPCVDFENDIVYWFGYTTHSVDESEANKVIITAWDISEVDLDSPDESKVKLISKITVDYFGVMQGRKCFDGDIYMSAINPNKPHESRLLRLDAKTGTVKTKLEFGSLDVIEGVSVMIQGNNIKWYISDYYDLYNIKLEKQIKK